MANNIKCTCGHSWSKGSSSKKDMHVCHMCGKDNTMKDGGWLDNYGKKPNPNDVTVSTGPGYVGLGYDVQGRDYSPAWGGQFQNGGSLWNTDKTAWVDSIHNARKADLNFVQRMFDQSAGSIQIPGQRGTSTHFMESGDNKAYPTVVQMPNGKLQYLNQNDRNAAWNYANKTGQFIKFPTDEQAAWYADNGYKKGTGVLKKNQMGGSLPGAVGFTYARVAGSAPANGKYAKKTKASAQNGKDVQKERYNELYAPIENKVFDAIGTQDSYDRLPSSTKDFLNKTIAGFSVASNRNIPPMDPIIKEVQEKVKKLPKEEISKLLKTDWSEIGLAGAMKNTPSSVSYLDMLKYVNHFNKLKKKGYTLQNGGEMKFYQEGLDFKPNSIAQDGKAVKDETMVKKPIITSSIVDSKKQALQKYAREMAQKEQPTLSNFDPLLNASAREQLYKETEQNKLSNQLLKGADVATDLMQLGNFIPNPVGQLVGNIGNVTGGWLDAYQAYDAYNKGDYGDAAINLASVAVPMQLGSSTFRRNSKYLQPGQPLHFLKGNKRVNYIEPFTNVKGMTNKSLMANRALLGTLGAETAYDSYQDGGAIVDPMGQWAHPGEVTIIPSTDITMEGVDYPVLGISDTGDTQYMEPGEDYNFDGEYVTEYPMMKKGGWLNKYK